MNERSEKIKNLWDKAMSDYDSHMRTTGHYDAQFRLASSFEQYFDSPILDLAAGTGFLAERLLNSGHELILNDSSEEMIHFLEEKFANNLNVKIMKQDAHSIHLDKKVTTILCCNLLFYLNDRISALRSWKDSLQENGRIIVLEEFPFQRPKTDEMKDHEKELMDLITPMSPDQIKELFQKEGFSLIAEDKTPIDNIHDLYGFVYKL